MRDEDGREMRAASLTRRHIIAGVAAALGGLAASAVDLRAAVSERISRTGESIHQEVVFNGASRQRVFDALTDSQQFDKVVQLSAAGMSLGQKPTGISREAGGAFSLFGGHILGRHIELTPNERIVQAWRVVDWEPGTYSIVTFKLAEHRSGTRLTLDHTSFPAGQARHLADGWKSNYWEPLGKYLA